MPKREEVISFEALKRMDEYSCSLPTLTTIGKRWRCATKYTGPRTEWKIATFVEHPNPERVGIEWAWAVREPGVPWETDCYMREVPDAKA